jgi:hypothetical protein
MARTELETKVWEQFEKGLTDNEILNYVLEELNENMSYMDLRILRADYEEEHPETVEEPEPEPEETEEEAAEAKAGEMIEMDSIRKPGSLLSGSGNLPSGARINWALDQSGRISIQPEGEAQPTQEDLQIFQEELQSELMKRGGMV